MNVKICRTALCTLVALSGWLVATAAPAATILTVYAAGTLAVPFEQAGKAFEKLHPGVTVEGQFGGSVMMARRITDLHQHADVFAAADYSVIPEILGKAGQASWFVGFAANAVTLAYTPTSAGADRITPDNWYRVVSEPGVTIGRSDPDTDPSGYQFLQMLSLASVHYHQPGLAASVLANAPKSAMRDTETSLISALQVGQIDYLAIYTSTAIAHHLEYVHLPADIDLGDPAKAAAYARGTAHTSNGVRQGKPIVYAATVPDSADHRALAIEFLRFLAGPEGQRIMSDAGFEALQPAWVHGMADAPAALQAVARAWPGHLSPGG